MTQLFMVRHGPTHVKKLIGWTDVPADLSDRQAIAGLKGMLPDLPVVSSDLLRARQTADAIQGARHRLPHAASFREIHMGAWEDRSWTEIDDSTPGALRQYYEQPGDTAPPEGESWNQLSQRVHERLTDLLAHHPKGLIVVAHMGPILTVVQRARDISAYDALAQVIAPLSVSQFNYDGAFHEITVNQFPAAL